MTAWMAARMCFFLVCAFANPPGAGAREDLLEPEQAFQFAANLIDSKTVEVRYRIADGYYMYRDRFRFSSTGDSVRIAQPRLPTGRFVEDQFYGKVQTYRDSLVIRIPLASSLPPDGFTLNVVSQGCADVGVCYTPLIQSAHIQAAAAISAVTKTDAESSGLLQKLRGLRNQGGDEGEFLPVERAFAIDVRVRDAKTLVVRFVPAETYYLYRDKIGFVVDPGSAVAIDKVELPAGELRKDPNFGDTQVFHRPFEARVRLRSDSSSASTLNLKVSYQGCSEKGLCYPPAHKNFSLKLPSAEAASSPLPAPREAVSREAQPGSAVQLGEDHRIARILKSGGFWVVMASFLGFGLLLSFTPCVFPMIPILSGIIAGQGHHVTHLRGFILSAAYVLGMAIAYAVAGVAAGLSGTLLSAALQNPWVLGGFAAVFVVLALSMFGFYELQLPVVLQSRAATASNRLRGGTLTGVFLMGALSAVIVGPCIAAPLAGALLYISQSRDVVLGGSALFAMALGMGAPLLAVGVSAGTLLPKAGAWMQTVRNFFGVVLIAAAIWIVSPLLPSVVHMFAWAALLIVSAIYLHALDPLPPTAGGIRKLWKGVGIIALLVGAALMLGALSGGRDILQPLSGLRAASSGTATADGTAFVRIKSVGELESAVALSGRPTMLDFYADWCVSCKEMERFTFSDPRVREKLHQMLLLQADVTADTGDDRALLQKFGLFGPPAIIFFDRTGTELSDFRVIGFEPTERFLPVLEKVISR